MSANLNHSPSLYKNHSAFSAGYEAARAGDPMDEPPGLRTQDRQYWFEGYCSRMKQDRIVAAGGTIE